MPGMVTVVVIMVISLAQQTLKNVCLSSSFADSTSSTCFVQRMSVVQYVRVYANCKNKYCLGGSGELESRFEFVVRERLLLVKCK